MSEESNVKVVSADCSALGLFSLGLVALVGSESLLTGEAGPATAWILCLAAFAQVWAAGIAFKSNNIFGGTVFGAYGLFWFSMGVTDILGSGFFGSVLSGADYAHALFFVCIGYLVFSVLMTYASVYTNKLLVVVVGLITILFFGLTLQTSGSGASTAGQWIADISRFVLAIACFYGTGAITINTMLGRTVWPVGAKK